MSELLIEVGKVLEDFLALFFDIQSKNSDLQNEHSKLENLYVAKRLFVQRRVAKKIKSFEGEIPKFKTSQIDLANQIVAYLGDEENSQRQLQDLERYCAFALYHPEGISFHKDWVLFQNPKKLDFENLVELEEIDGVKKSALNKLTNRDGFKLTDQGANLDEVLGETNYCIYCHKQGKDSCRTGLKEKDQTFKTNHSKVELSGCPLDEKISEMNLLKNEGKSLAALAIAIVDNPLIAGTGHRICNDCMKSCIYQKQEPVDIPQVETRTLKDVLNLPFGFEIYSLLTRWNPLNLKNPLPKDPSGKKVLVAGLGPAGYTLAHYLLNEGHLVVGVDGLKIEPLDPEISGIDMDGNRKEFAPIKDIKSIYRQLDERNFSGFGGVAEYGITVRWDKNFLKIIRLLLERREYFRMFGGFRLGSALDCFDALKEQDFDHVALCLGAGWAKIPEIENNLLKGVRMASDFLMALQLTGAERKDLPSNLQVRLPILVVGSGLTAVDTTTEALAYYPKQVENFANHYENLCKKLGKAEVEKSWGEEDKLIAQEFINHHKIILEAKNAGENIPTILQKLGGAKIIYRKSLQESPAYRLNHEEVQKAFEEGIEFVENTTPIKAIDDGFGHIEYLIVKNNLGDETKMPARALFLAAGTTPNKAPFYEDKLKFELDGGTFQIIDLLGKKLPAMNSPKSEGIGFLCAKNDQGKAVSFFGDLHPSFNGSVVKAMASAKNGYPIINEALESLENKAVNYDEFLNHINQEFAVKVKEVNILSDYFIELVVQAPLLAKKTKLGHIFRLHNFHSIAKKTSKITLAMEGVAVTTYKVDPESGTITVMIVNAGGSSSLVKNLEIGEPIIFMGPSGTPTHNFENKNIILIAGGRGIFPLAGLASQYKKNGCNVILFCGFKNIDDLVRHEELINSCSDLVLSFEEGDSEEHFSGNIIDAVKNHFKNPKQKIDVVLTMGNEAMMHKVADLYHGNLKTNLSDAAVGITSLSSPMQCMLKGVCSQCLQKKIDPKTGKERFFYACVGQDQKLGEIDFDFLKNRCGQNSLSEKLTKLTIQNV
ncbi:MAG: NADPH-dependent glutamate synthase beta subunit-like oxidoreductase/NAD(P)H-flavin reductase [Rickettsiales bacterium]|jgi:NADPH-dependent glutamate synthase beta subunit-like oxidoreductase/NAD(P)H-flavin reductase